MGLRIRDTRVRFLGATLWTSYGNGNSALMEIGSRMMSNIAMIGAERWIDASRKNARRCQKCWTATIRRDPGRVGHCFEPTVALDFDTRTVAWLDSQLRRTGAWDNTEVVTHHWPSWDVLVAKGVIRQREISLDPHN